MTDPQTSAPEPGRGTPGVAQDNPSVPAQGRTAPDSAARQAETDVPGRGGQDARDRTDGDVLDQESPEQHYRAEAGRAQARAGATIARMAWPVALTVAIGMIAVGIILLVWPKATLAVVAILIGAALVVTGIFKLFQGVTGGTESGGMRAANIVIGILAVIAGLYCLRHHALTILAVTLVVGVLWIIHGISDLIAASSMGKGSGRGVTILTGILGLAAGFVVLFWPGISLILLLLVLAAWLLAYGLLLLFLAFGLRRDQKTLTRAADPAAAATA
jgi:uncharacterized membrane protein HdeD (DUF308 family)